MTPDPVYPDYSYGNHPGRADITHRMVDRLHCDAGPADRWKMFDAVKNGDLADAGCLSNFTFQLPEFAGRQLLIDGMSRFELRDGLISCPRAWIAGAVN